MRENLTARLRVEIDKAAGNMNDIDLIEVIDAMDELSKRVQALEQRTAQPISISCFTNIDDFRSVEWPTIAAYPPVVGERVRGEGGDLRVVGVTHAVGHDGLPYLRVELHR